MVRVVYRTKEIAGSLTDRYICNPTRSLQLKRHHACLRRILYLSSCDTIITDEGINSISISMMAFDGIFPCKT